MADVDTRYEAMTRRMIVKASGGALVTFQRVTGLAPNTTLISAEVNALVRSYQPDGVAESQSGYSGSQMGAITLGDRQILVMASDLAAKGFPLPLRKNDNAIVADTGEKLKITRVDMTKRAIAACIEAWGVTA
jgi:hypothetical protein